VIRVRRFLPDAVEAELIWQYELEYRPLSQRYIVRNVNSGLQDSYATLYSALNNLGRIQGLPVIDDSLLDSGSRYRVRLRAALSTSCSLASSWCTPSTIVVEADRTSK
jgi:hypothetical protein